ncbi:hypothetical protein HDV05_006915, partial [Chytridiales sp. JEL 0842]
SHSKAKGKNQIAPEPQEDSVRQQKLNGISNAAAMTFRDSIKPQYISGENQQTPALVLNGIKADDGTSCNQNSSKPYSSIPKFLSTTNADTIDAAQRSLLINDIEPQLMSEDEVCNANQSGAHPEIELQGDHLHNECNQETKLALKAAKETNLSVCEINTETSLISSKMSVNLLAASKPQAALSTEVVAVAEKFLKPNADVFRNDPLSLSDKICCQKQKPIHLDNSNDQDNVVLSDDDLELINEYGQFSSFLTALNPVDLIKNQVVNGPDAAKIAKTKAFIADNDSDDDQDGNDMRIIRSDSDEEDDEEDDSDEEDETTKFERKPRQLREEWKDESTKP